MRASAVLDVCSTVLFCSIISLFIVPRIVEVLFSYIPRYSKMLRKGYFRRGGIGKALLEVLFWLIVVGAVYAFMYFIDNTMFWMLINSAGAYAAWGIGLVNIVYTLAFRRQVARDTFYSEVFMQYVKPESLEAYNKFLAELELMDIGQLQRLDQEKLIYPLKNAVAARIEVLSKKK
jgi:hypothetical protein